MEFFNKKEEVIDFKLTQFGRLLLSKGKFKPVYYSFFDDDVIYNTAKVNIVEEQNTSEKRIKDTPTLHPQISFSPLEKEFNSNYGKVLSGEESATSEDLQRTPEKHYALPQPIGTSDINSEYSPSWSAQFLKGGISGSVGYLVISENSGGKNTQIIPQINTKLEIEMIKMSETENNNLDEYEDGFAGSDVAILSDDEDLFVLLKMQEVNGLFQKKNFDIEIFEIEEQNKFGETIETLRPLSFSIMPEEENVVDFVDGEVPEEDTTYVDYYFDVLVDDEISDDILCQLDPVNENMGVFSDPRTKLCQDIINQQKKQVFNIYEDQDGDPGEIC